MNLNNFLGRLDESSSKKLNEAEGDVKGRPATELIDSIKDKWAYVPNQEYGGILPVVVEEGGDNWSIYYLDKVGSAAAGEEEDWGDVDSFAAKKNESSDEDRLRRFFENGMKPLHEEIEGAKDTAFENYIVSRKSTGGFAKILEECVNIVDKK